MKLTGAARQHILAEVDALELVPGKTTLTIELNCGTGSILNSMKVKTITEKEVKP